MADPAGSGRNPVTGALGRTRWAIAEGYIPPHGTGDSRQLTSHETVCILNAGNQDAQVSITVFFADREPVGPYRLTVGARRTRHVRFTICATPPRSRSTPISPA